MKDKYWVFIALIMILLGSICNDFAIAHNDGKMPVKGFLRENKYVTTALHQPLTEDTNFPYLTDIFFGFSIGDILRILGVIPLYLGLTGSGEEKK